MEVSRFRLSFNYALYGDDVKFLQTDYRYNGTVNLLHWVPVQENNEWMTFVGDFNASSKFTVQYTAVKKRGDDGYIAIDNVTITELLDDKFTTTGIPITMPTFIEKTHTRAVTYEHPGKDSGRTVLPTIGKTSLNRPISKSTIDVNAARRKMTMYVFTPPVEQ
ncbi:uncharacterized protein LOC117122724 [Anneissia japonica]|uniref:uncharacterized protein LOC117122724 n=1 Tax=Anneissia japonica TaxID=1529436 RepID=UPI0014259320|nr:uncharacterized protein LOC117122724 [Anneissia japonica]